MNSYRKGIDVSEHNGIIDWGQVKASGMEFAMIRAGYGQRLDRQFRRNIEECIRTGLPCGVYWFSYAQDAAGAAREAAACLNAIAPCPVTLPVAYDLEYDTIRYAQTQGVTIGMETASDMARSFCRAIRETGHPVINYANPDYLSRYFDEQIQTEFPLWLAQWPNGTPDLSQPPRACEMWQYSAKGRVPGITGPVDLDVCYVAYPKNGKENPTMTGEQIYHTLNAYLNTLPIPEWAEKEYAEARALGITDGKNPLQLIPRYQAAIMAKRAMSANPQ